MKWGYWSCTENLKDTKTAKRTEFVYPSLHSSGAKRYGIKTQKAKRNVLFLIMDGSCAGRIFVNNINSMRYHRSFKQIHAHIHQQNLCSQKIVHLALWKGLSEQERFELAFELSHSEGISQTEINQTIENSLQSFKTKSRSKMAFFFFFIENKQKQ